ncbi:MAG: hypothetical protein ACE5H9_03105 [Anaerolineae bacterium]
MSFVRQLEASEAPPEVKRMYRAVQKQRGFIFSNWKVLAHAPRILRGFGPFIFAVLNPAHLEQRILELAILKTSLLNRCPY